MLRAGSIIMYGQYSIPWGHLHKRDSCNGSERQVALKTKRHTSVSTPAKLPMKHRKAVVNDEHGLQS